MVRKITFHFHTVVFIALMGEVCSGSDFIWQDINIELEQEVEFNTGTTGLTGDALIGELENKNQEFFNNWASC